MNFQERINAVLHLSDPDQVPFALYIESFPSGDYERILRNRGMGLVVRKPALWEAMPHVQKGRGPARAQSLFPFLEAGESRRHKLEIEPVEYS
jgi:hypothetical protein